MTKRTFVGLLLLVLLPFVLLAQERTDDGAAVSDSAEIEVEASYDNARSNRATAVDTDINICDGVTCPDGSCAATRDECVVEATISPDIYESQEHERALVTCPADAAVRCPDGRCVADRESCAAPAAEVQVQNSRPVATDEARSAQGISDVDGDGVPDFRDLDSDGDSIPDQVERHNSSRSNETEGRARSSVVTDDGEDAIDEDDGVIEPAQDYNSTRSNRRKNTFFDPDNWLDDDDDNDGVPTLARDRAQEFRAATPEMRCGATHRVRDEGSLWCWGQGVRAAAVGDSDDDGSVATSTRVLRYVSVRGDAVRSWSEAERAQFARYRELTESDNEPEVLTTNIVDLVLQNERISEIEVDDTEASVRYRARLRLFGFIPMDREVVARASDAEEMTIEYPWYSFLARKPDTNAIEGVFSSLSTMISVHGGGAGKATFSDFSS